MNKDIDRKIKQLMQDINRFVAKDLPRIAGKEAVDEFRGNFQRQGFRNNGVTPWKDVKRRDPKSPWYGFNYKGERRDRSKDTKKHNNKQYQ